MKLLDRLFGKKGTNESLLVGSPRVNLTPAEAERLKKQHEQELERVAPLQTKLREETAMLKEVVNNKLTKSQRKEAKELLAAGEDPLLLAAYLKVPFREVAIIANDVLKAAYGNSPEAPQIPTDIAQYIALAKAMEAKSATPPPVAS